MFHFPLNLPPSMNIFKIPLSSKTVRIKKKCFILVPDVHKRGIKFVNNCFIRGMMYSRRLGNRQKKIFLFKRKSLNFLSNRG